MTRISEINGGQSAMSALLKDGLTQLSGDQHVTFRLYRKFSRRSMGWFIGSRFSLAPRPRRCA